jgi:hypothetical protein
MALLLARDDVTLYPAAAPGDDHGWAAPGTDPAWAGTGNFQARPGRSATLAADAGGHGPYDPLAGSAGVLYLPPDAPVEDGMVAELRGARYALSQCYRVPDPIAGGALDCWAAIATGLDGWPP